MIPLMLEGRIEVSKAYRSPVRRQRAFFKGHPERSWHFDKNHWFSRNGVALRTNDDPWLRKANS